MTDTQASKQQTDSLKLVALDPEDLNIVSAHLQDAVMRVGDLIYLRQERRFAIVLNRFVWTAEKASRGEATNQRRRSGLHFERVERVQTINIRQDAPDAVLNLLAIQFHPTEAAAGTIDLIFSGNGLLRLHVDCIEAQISDLGGAWETPSRPTHDLEDAG